jgi:DNA-binding MarR family transcriptional regulator
MKHKKIIIASIVTVIILAISYTASYYKTLTNEHQFTLKRNAIFEYLWENNNTSFSKELTEDIKRSL